MKTSFGNRRRGRARSHRGHGATAKAVCSSRADFWDFVDDYAMLVRLLLCQLRLAPRIQREIKNEIF
jgi:hypothetical protein